MAEQKDTILELACKKWHTYGEEVRAEENRLDTADEMYSDDFEYLYTAIASTNIDPKRVEEAQLELKRRHGKLAKSDAFKTALSNFNSSSKVIYDFKNPKKIEAARAYLKKMGWLPKPVTPRPQPQPEPFRPQPFRPQPVRPEPIKPDPFGKGGGRPQPVRPVRPEPVRPVPPFRTRRKASFFERVDDWFDTIQAYLDIWLEYISQYAATVFYILAGIVGVVAVILTFFSGHWFIAILEVLAFVYIGVYAVAIGGYLAELVLKGLVYGLKLIFRRWWTFVLTVVLAVGIPVGTSLYNQAQDRKYHTYVEQAIQAVEEERYLDAREKMTLAADMEYEKSTELRENADKMVKEAAKKAAELKKSIPQALKKVQRQKKSSSGFVDETDAIQSQITLLRHNERPSSSADKFQEQLDQLRMKKGVTLPSDTPKQ